MPYQVGGGLLADIWNADKRGRAVGIYSLAPLLGPSLGPIAGGFIAQDSTWKWVFWAVTIADGVVQVLGLLFLKESK
jgi:MFS family permease